jgi:hypothetical protein
MQREACGYALANRGYNTRAIQVWLGHRFRRGRGVKRCQPSPAATAAAPHYQCYGGIVGAKWLAGQLRGLRFPGPNILFRLS